MKLFYILMVLCAFGCTQAEKSLITLNNLGYIDASSAITQHPLVCGAERDFPKGKEYAFENSQSKEFVHAVFPGNVTVPDTLEGIFTLNGHFQSIQNKEGYTGKQLPEGYKYFVVSSWERKE